MKAQVEFNVDPRLGYGISGNYKYDDRHVVEAYIRKDGVFEVNLIFFTEDFEAPVSISVWEPKFENGEFEFPGEWKLSKPTKHFSSMAEVDDFVNNLPNWYDVSGAAKIVAAECEGINIPELPF